MKKQLYFFVTVEEKNNDGRHYLRALAGQNLKGKPIDPNLNVHAPQRVNDVPDRYFCSDHLELITTSGESFYTVYHENDENSKVYFKEVSSPDGKNDVKNGDPTAEAAFQLFMRNKTQAPQRPDWPADRNGVAYPIADIFDEDYDGQVDRELKLLCVWMNREFQRRKLRPAVKIQHNDNDAKLYAGLLSAGESIDTICDARRLNTYEGKTGIQLESFTMMAEQPCSSYLTWLHDEHTTRHNCTAMMHNALNQIEVAEVTALTAVAYSIHHCTMLSMDDTDQRNIQNAMESGWTIHDMIRPENLDKESNDFASFTAALANGTIAPPVSQNPGPTALDKMRADKRNACPTDEDGFHIDKDTWEDLIYNVHTRENTLLVGPTGSGKTQVVELLSSRLGLPLTKIQMGLISDPTEQLVGKMDIDENGHTYFDWSEFARAIQHPGIVLLDELNRVPRNGGNALFSCLDHTRELTADSAKGTDKRTIKVHPECVFFATANIGDEYTGTHDIDTALETRFMRIEMNYISQNDEAAILVSRCGVTPEDAMVIANVAAQIRNASRQSEIRSISTRETLRCAKRVQGGFSVKRAMESVILPLYSECNEDTTCSERQQVRSIIQGVL